MPLPPPLDDFYNGRVDGVGLFFAILAGSSPYDRCQPAVGVEPTRVNTHHMQSVLRLPITHPCRPVVAFGQWAKIWPGLTGVEPVPSINRRMLSSDNPGQPAHCLQKVLLDRGQRLKLGKMGQ